ncbi:hypothetical protein [uncultured Stenotrophomonas sp.]|nr:hypothetical protein [uncultured Stenotrophomonas sp.]
MPVWLQIGQIDEWMAASKPPATVEYHFSCALNTPRNNREDLLQQVA